jgi:hypothetical protein
MRTWTKALYVALVLCFGGAVGCGQKVDMEKTVSLGLGDIEVPFIVSPPKSQQSVTVEVSSGAPVDVYLLLEENREAVKNKLKAGKAPDASHLIASEMKTTSGTLQGTVPAGKEYAVVVAGAKKNTEVKLKLKGR